MPEEIRPADIYRPPTLRRISRDGREENDRRFRERFAEVMSEHHESDEEHERPPEPTPDAASPQQTADEETPAAESEKRPRPAEADAYDDPGLGHNLDREL